MTFQFTKNGLQSLEALDKAVKTRILKKLKIWQKHNTPLSFAKPIKEIKGLFRFRVGDYRIIVSPNYEQNTLDILKAGHKTKVYDF